jgi:hypothetical protein
VKLPHRQRGYKPCPRIRACCFDCCAAAGAPSASASAAASAMADFIIVISLFHGAAGGEDNRPRAPLSRRNRRSRNTAFAIPSDSARLTRCANFQ